MSTDIRQQVRAEILKVMSNAKAEGRNEIAVAQQTFPGVPKTILYELSSDLLFDEEEAWWRTIERTIDGELIRSAITN